MAVDPIKAGCPPPPPPRLGWAVGPLGGLRDPRGGGGGYRPPLKPWDRDRLYAAYSSGRGTRTYGLGRSDAVAGGKAGGGERACACRGGDLWAEVTLGGCGRGGEAAGAGSGRRRWRRRAKGGTAVSEGRGNVGGGSRVGQEGKKKAGSGWWEPRARAMSGRGVL